MSFKVELKHRVYNETLWIVMGNDYPVGEGFETEALAIAYCNRQMEQQRHAQTEQRYNHGMLCPTIYYRPYAITFNRRK